MQTATPKPHFGSLRDSCQAPGRFATSPSRLGNQPPTEGAVHNVLLANWNWKNQPPVSPPTYREFLAETPGSQANGCNIGRQQKGLSGPARALAAQPPSVHYPGHRLDISGARPPTKPGHLREVSGKSLRWAMKASALAGNAKTRTTPRCGPGIGNPSILPRTCTLSRAKFL